MYPPPPLQVGGQRPPFMAGGYPGLPQHHPGYGPSPHHYPMAAGVRPGHLYPPQVSQIEDMSHSLSHSVTQSHSHTASPGVRPVTAPLPHGGRSAARPPLPAAGQSNRGHVTQSQSLSHSVTQSHSITRGTARHRTTTPWRPECGPATSTRRRSVRENI